MQTVIRTVADLKKHASIAAKKTPYYQALTQRRFRDCNGYPEYKRVASDLSVTLMTVSSGLFIKGEEQDPAYFGILHSAWMAWQNPIFPVYAITRDLVEAFLNTNVPDHICSLPQMFDFALFLLPKDLIKNPEGHSCNWVLVTDISYENVNKFIAGYAEFLNLQQQSIPIELVLGINQGERKLRWVTSLGVFQHYANTMYLPSDGNSPVLGDFVVDERLPKVDRDKELEFVSTVDRVILQTLLYMQLPLQHEKIVLPSSTAKIHSAKGFGNDPLLEPIWIGADYHQKRVKRAYQGGSHASPMTHWRRGHWRDLTMSDGTFKQVWVKPAIVNAR